MNPKKKIAWSVRISSIGLATGILSYMLYTNDDTGNTQQQTTSSYSGSREYHNHYSSDGSHDFRSQSQGPGTNMAPNQNGGFDTTTGGT